MTYCIDCPDREACHQGMSCDLARRFAAAAHIYQQKMRGNTMAKNSTDKATVESVVEQATEEKLVVPAQQNEAQDDGSATKGEKTAEETPELKVIEGGKKSVKERFSAVAEKLKKNQKNVYIVVGTATGIATMAFLKYAKKKAEEAVLGEQVELTEDVVDEPTTDESAA